MNVATSKSPSGTAIPGCAPLLLGVFSLFNVALVFMPTRYPHARRSKRTGDPFAAALVPNAPVSRSSCVPHRRVLDVDYWICFCRAARLPMGAVSLTGRNP
jgi:hypothetical protein